MFILRSVDLTTQKQSEICQVVYVGKKKLLTVFFLSQSEELVKCSLSSFYKLFLLLEQVLGYLGQFRSPVQHDVEGILLFVYIPKRCLKQQPEQTGKLVLLKLSHFAETFRISQLKNWSSKLMCSNYMRRGPGLKCIQGSILFCERFVYAFLIERTARESFFFTEGFLDA